MVHVFSEHLSPVEESAGNKKNRRAQRFGELHDLETKAKAIAHCEPQPTKPAKRWSQDKGLMTFLQSL
jgi:hypothetical protein